MVRRRSLLILLACTSALTAAVVPGATVKTQAAASPPVVTIGPTEYRDLSGGCYGTYTVTYTGVNVPPNALIFLDYGDGFVDAKVAIGFSYTFASHYFHSTSLNEWVQTATVFPGGGAISGEGVGAALTTKLLGPDCP